MAVETDGLEDELELLSAMWSEDELQICRSPAEVADVVKGSLTARLTPMTAGDEGLQHLWCELRLEIPPEYPDEAPLLALGASRGLSDEARNSMLLQLQELSQQLLGGPALHSVLEAGREELTKLNSAPSGSCAICLASLSESPEERSQQSEMQAAASNVHTPCFHVFHFTCLAECWKSHLSKHSGPSSDLSSAMACPECRSDIPLAAMPQFQSFLPLPQPEVIDATEENAEKDSYEFVEPREVAQSFVLATETPTEQPEAFIRLHHLHQGNDPKEKPLLRLLKEFGLNAIIYYGKPALLHIQGEGSDVDAFAGTAKRRHITVTIEVALRRCGPAIASGITAIPAKKASLDGATLKDHLDKRKLGETQFTIVGP